MRFLIDMPVTPQAVTHLQAKGHDAVHASAIGLGAKPDSEILDRARAEGRIDCSITVVDQHRIRRRSLPVMD